MIKGYKSVNGCQWEKGNVAGEWLVEADEAVD